LPLASKILKTFAYGAKKRRNMFSEGNVKEYWHDIEGSSVVEGTVGFLRIKGIWKDQ